MALKLQLTCVCLVLQLMGCHGSECSTATAEYDTLAGTGTCLQKNPCPDDCKTKVANFFAKCAGTSETYTTNGQVFKVGEYPIALVGVLSVSYLGECSKVAFDESVKTIKTCEHAHSLMYIALSKPSPYPYCDTTTTCDKRCQTAIDNILAKCKNGDKYTKDDGSIGTVDESELATALKLLGPDACTYTAKKSIISSTLSNPWQFAVFLATAISWSFVF